MKNVLTELRHTIFQIFRGTDNVGAMVVFENGKPAKRKYRIFKIKSFEGADDYAAMREVIYRRFRHALEEEEQVEKGTL